MKVIVVSTNQLKKPVPVVPVGAGMIYSSIYEHRYEVAFLDMMFLECPLEALTEKLKSFEPDVICLSIRNIDNQVLQKQEFYLPFLKQVIIVCRNNSEGKIVIGGAAMQVMPVELMDYLKADFGISGYGEQEIILLLNYLEQNLIIKEGSRLRTAGNFFNPLLSSLPRKEIFDPRYFNMDSSIKKTIMGYQTSRGCTGKCIYCNTGCSEGQFCRVTLEQLEQDMERLVGEYGISKVTFVDDIFNQDMESTMEICDSLVHSGRGLQWTCSLNPGTISEELIHSIKKAGCVFVDLGIDSGSDLILENMGKGFQTEHLLILGRLLEKYGIMYSVSLLFGGPGENEQTVRETIKNINMLKPVYVLAGMGIRIYPHTSLYEIAVGEGMLKEHEDLLLPSFYKSKEFSADILKVALANSEHTYKNMLMQIL